MRGAPAVRNPATTPTLDRVDGTGERLGTAVEADSSDGPSQHVEAKPVDLGVIASPRLDERAVAGLAGELEQALRERYPDVRWRVPVVTDALVQPPAGLAEMVDAARARLLDEGWDLAIHLTDIPLRLARRPLLSHASPTHGVALVSVPAHGVVRVGGRLRDSLADAVSALVGDARRTGAGSGTPEGTRRAQERLHELAADVEEPAAESIVFPARVIGANLRLLLGMIRANRPWRLVVRLSRAVVAALAVVAVTVIFADVWRISASLGILRLVGLMLLSLSIAVVAPIALHGLWERSAGRRSREQVMLFNAATLATLALGITTLYLEIFVVALPGTALLIEPKLLGSAIGHPAHLSDYLRLDWLVCSLATVGGALGAALESDAAIREAAYASGPRDERTQA